MIEGLEALAPDVPVILVGPPGVGKTSNVNQLAKEREARLIAQYPAVRESVDFGGFPALRDNWAEWVPMGQMAKDITDPNCPPTILLLDDLGQANPQVLAAVMHLTLERVIGDRPIHPNVSIVGCTNRPKDKSGAKGLLAALINRALVLDVNPPNTRDWANWVFDQSDIDPLIGGYAQFRTDTFTQEIPDTPNTPWCTPRSLAMAGKLMKRKQANLTTLTACVSKSRASDILAYAQAASKVNIFDWLNAPKKQKWPKEDPGLCHAITVLAASYAAEHGDKIIDLAGYLTNEWSVAMVSAAERIHPDIKKSKAFVRWAYKAKESGIV